VTATPIEPTMSPPPRAGRRAPILVVLVASVAVAFFALPLLGLLQRTPWSQLWADLSSEQSRDALRLSLVCSIWATVLSIVLGVPLAWLLARVDFVGRPLIRALVLLPMIVPPVVGGVALLFAFGRSGLVGEQLYDWFGIQFTFHTSGAILAETFVAMPFLVITVEAGLRSVDTRYEEAAATLGAGRWTTFRRVTVPFIAPSLVAGAALAWARALGEFGATITFAGNIQGRTQTMPLAVYLALESRPESAIALSLVMVAISIVVLVSLRDRWFPSASA
jgi:molybdate transport system permease protein